VAANAARRPGFPPATANLIVPTFTRNEPVKKPPLMSGEL
jgi:hypothetical protein